MGDSNCKICKVLAVCFLRNCVLSFLCPFWVSVSIHLLILHWMKACVKCLELTVKSVSCSSLKECAVQNYRRVDQQNAWDSISNGLQGQAQWTSPFKLMLVYNWYDLEGGHLLQAKAILKVWHQLEVGEQTAHPQKITAMRETPPVLVLLTYASKENNLNTELPFPSAAAPMKWL